MAVAAVAVERRLAAIMSADVVGYSRLMGDNEAGTLARLKVLRHDLLEPLLADHRGRIVNFPGDNALCEFPSVVEAVRCAVEVQRRLTAQQAAVEPASRLRLRIGVNVGDIILDHTGAIYGDGVNVAARLEGLAEPDGVTISGAVLSHVRHKLDLAYAPMGTHAVKNIKDPVEVW